MDALDLRENPAGWIERAMHSVILSLIRKPDFKLPCS